MLSGSNQLSSCLGAVSHIVGGLGTFADGVVVVKGAAQVCLALLESGHLLLQVRDRLVVVGCVTSGNIAVAIGWGTIATVAASTSDNVRHHSAQNVQNWDSKQRQEEEKAESSNDES